MHEKLIIILRSDEILSTSLLLTGWNCSFPESNNIIWLSGCQLTSVELLRKFFEFYSDSSLIDYVLCTLTGSKVEKKCFVEDHNDLPDEFETFKRGVTEDEQVFKERIGDFQNFCIQAPFDLFENTTKILSATKFTRFVELCKQTTKLFDSWEEKGEI